MQTNFRKLQSGPARRVAGDPMKELETPKGAVTGHPRLWRFLGGCALRAEAFSSIWTMP